MAEHEVKIKRFTVTFDTTPPITPKSIKISPLNEERTISVEQGITFLVFELVTLPPGTTPIAQFPAYPFVWFETNEQGNNTPVAQPGCFEVQWYNPRQCTLMDRNTAIAPNPHPFNVVVTYDNQTYGTDPTIVNEPPVG